MRSIILFLFLVFMFISPEEILAKSKVADGSGGPKMICYSLSPNRYINDHAAKVAKIYDGFFFVVGPWDSGVENYLGIDSLPKDPRWKNMVKKNVAALRKVGATENLLDVYFGSHGVWPSPETLLSDDFSKKLTRHFSAVARTAKELGFRGISIDTEYPYPRYEVDNEIYTYDGYTVDDLLAAAREKGRVVMTAILNAFPEAVIFQLPGQIRSRPIDRQFVLGLIEVMAEKNAPGGFHLGMEYTYGMHDPVSDMASVRYASAAIPLMVNEKTGRYWREKCTIAPGTWPLHMAETGAKNYPVQPWEKEVQELRRQMSILRTVAKRYIWSYSGQPVWYVASEKTEKYGLKKQNLKIKDIDISKWQDILRDKPALTDPGLLYLAAAIKRFDRGELTGAGLCDAFGTPARWWALGLLGNPHTRPAYAADGACFLPVNDQVSYFGRDQVLHWFSFDNMNPTGIVSPIYLFDWYHTNDASAQFVSFIHSEQEHNAFLHVGWDDGIIVYLNGKIVFDARDYPKRGKGMLFKDRYQFEKRVPVTIEQGTTRLSVVSINSHGNWVFSLRFTDANNMPFKKVFFRLK